MVSQSDIEKAKKANEPHPDLMDVAARLFGCHDKHLERIEETRK